MKSWNATIKSRQEMKLEEVDGLFNGFAASYRRDESREVDALGRPLPRPSVFTRHYRHREKSVEHEHSYFVEVYFDKDGRAVGKWQSEYCGL